MNSRNFEFTKTWTGFIYTKAWWLKGIIDVAKFANSFSPGELIMRTGMLFAMPAAELTQNPRVINSTSLALDLALLVTNPLGFIANKTVIAAGDWKLEEWWGALTEDQRANRSVQEAFALMHVLKFEAARKAQIYVNKLEQQLEEDAAKQNSATKKEDAKPTSEPEKEQAFKQTTDYSKLDDLAAKGGKFYKHSRNHRGEVVNKRCDLNQAKEHIANGGTIEVKSGHHHRQKTWFGEKDMPKIREPIETIKTKSPVDPIKETIIKAEMPPPGLETVVINLEVVEPRPANPEEHNGPAFEAPIQHNHEEDDDVDRHRLIPQEDAPRQAAPGQPAVQPVSPAEKLEKHFTLLRNLIQDYALISHKRQHGFFAGQLPRHLAEINQAIKDFDSHHCSMQESINIIKNHAARLGNKHPIYLAALKCEGMASCIRISFRL